MRSSDVVRVMLARGADPDIRDGGHTATPASWANHAGKIDARDLLLDHSRDVFDLATWGRADALAEQHADLDLHDRFVPVAASLGVPVVLDVGPTGPTGESGPPPRVLEQVDRVLAGSAAALRDLQAHGLERLALWPCGVDLTAFHPSRRSESWRGALAPDGQRLGGAR